MRRFLLPALLAALAAAPAADARDQVVTSFDGTPIVTSFFPAAGLKVGAKAPTVLVGHGFGMSRETDPEGGGDNQLFGKIGLAALRKAGFNVLSWDARGFGQSGGHVMADRAEFEGRDVSALIDFVAKQPEAQLDSGGDPRVGMNGVSYGGAIQLVAAAQDDRIDAITPTISFNTVLGVLYKENIFKAGWGSVLGATEGTAALQGLYGPAGPQTGDFDPHLTQAVVEASATGHITGETYDYFASIGPGPRVARITAPTLFVQGTVDTLTTLNEAIASYRYIQNAGSTPVKMVWFCGGHGVCLTGKGPDKLVERSVVAWLKRYLAGERSVDTGPGFEWTDDDGKVHSAGQYPATAGQSVTATGSGTIAIKPGTGTGAAIAAAPAPDGLKVALPPFGADADLVGTPKLDLTYSGTAAPADTYVFAQVVDEGRGQVAGNVVQPIPVKLDGQRHSISRDIESIAQHAEKGTRYSLQLADSTNVYSQQRSAGAMQVESARVTVPTVVADPPGTATGGGKSKLRLKLSVRRKARGRLRLRVTGKDAGLVKRVRFYLRGHRVATRARRPFARTVRAPRIKRGRRYKAAARITLKSGSRATLTRRLHARR